MQFDRGKKIRLGFFILLGTLIFVSFFYLIGRSSQLFSKSVMLHTTFPSVNGLRAGDHVRFSGIIVGTISELEITTDTSVVVDMSVDRKMLKFIRKDSKVEIKPEALIGDKMIVIYSGTEDFDHVSEGDYLEPVGSVHLEDVVHQISQELKRTEIIIQNLDDITGKVNNGEGNIGRLLNDSSIAIKMDKSLDNFEALTNNLKQFTQQLNNPQSDLGKLMNEDQLTTQLDSILGKVDSMAEHLFSASRDLDNTTSQLSLAAEAVNSGGGFVNKILYDSAFADTIGITIENLNQTLMDMDRVAKNLQHKKLFGGTKEKK
jgi:phospholipid/cholesterol/gamma-HCH transport system substrate-binding protein